MDIFFGLALGVATQEKRDASRQVIYETVVVVEGCCETIGHPGSGIDSKLACQRGLSAGSDVRMRDEVSVILGFVIRLSLVWVDGKIYVNLLQSGDLDILLRSSRLL